MWSTLVRKTKLTARDTVMGSIALKSSAKYSLLLAIGLSGVLASRGASAVAGVEGTEISFPVSGGRQASRCVSDMAVVEEVTSEAQRFWYPTAFDA